MMVKSTMQNLRARVQKSGKTYYYFDAGGKPRKEIPLGSDYVLAVRKWAELSLCEDTAAPAANFIELIERYERDELPKLAKSTQATTRSDLKHLREFFGTPSPAPIDQIKPSHIQKLLDWKAAQPTTANRLKRLFSVLFNKARGWGYTEAVNPVTGIAGLKLKGKRKVYITDAIFKAVRDCGSAPLRDAMDLGYLTGQRPGDVLKLTEREIVEGALMVRQGKTGQQLRVTIEGELHKLIERIKARKAGYRVWCSNLTINMHGMPLSKQVLRDHFTAAKERAAQAHPDMAAEIADFWFYDLRTKASTDVQALRGLQEAADLLGHTSTQTTLANYSPKGKVARPTK